VPEVQEESILASGTETLAMKVNEMRRLERAAKNIMLILICGVMLKDKVWYAELMDRLRLEEGVNRGLLRCHEYV